ncbi:hypothetical protein EXIGLDRAFT_836520 [Exidia glandulosa HHB12029]|uniref:Yeast cell wall synthesis Kre9/Knh1-like N-terminal domain-containing protein n=1 Tax=Exidia glandulosa HHB12029 TaxID=1314781 RepID=A0A165HQM8_EXIGL|nr:hypothetical protein EXIGLDRAFT_836520 [Exidia glandulosa HHB12029]
MKFSLATLTIASALATVSAAPLTNTRDVWDPKITYPTTGTVWHLGETVTVKWDTSDAPKHISNGAAIYLRKGDMTIDSPLAEGFDLRKGHKTITIPSNFTAGTDYRVVLFGDSGNWSKKFTITK